MWTPSLMEGERNRRNNAKDKKVRSRNIMWFITPFNIAVKTKIGNFFFYLLNKHFSRSNTLYKILNRNKIKLS